MAIAVRKAKELTKLLSNDPQLRGELHTLIAATDRSIAKSIQQAVLSALQRGQIDIRLLEHDGVTEALTNYYKGIKLSSKFIKMY